MKSLETMYMESPTKTKSRMKIIEISAKLFSDVGIDTMTLTDIATQCDMTIRNFYRYYASKEYLVIDVAYYLFYKMSKYQDYGIGENGSGIEQLEQMVKTIAKIEQSEVAGLSFIKFIMYFDLYLTNMPSDHPAFIKYKDIYVPKLQDVGTHNIESVLRLGYSDGTIDIDIETILIDVEYIVQSLFSIIMRTLVKEHENEAINGKLVDQHINVLVAYYRKG